MYLVKGRQVGKAEIKGSLHDFLFRQTIPAVIFGQVRCCSQFCELASHSELQKSPSSPLFFIPGVSVTPLLLGGLKVFSQASKLFCHPCYQYKLHVFSEWFISWKDQEWYKNLLWNMTDIKIWPLKLWKDQHNFRERWIAQKQRDRQTRTMGYKIHQQKRNDERLDSGRDKFRGKEIYLGDGKEAEPVMLVKDWL